MATFKKNKILLQSLLLEPNWRNNLVEFFRQSENFKQLVSPLLSFLPRDDCRWQAVWGLGNVVPSIAESSMEEARVIIRRLMWSMNEESGNLGWGIPEAMGSILARSDALAKEYAHILFSYMHETGHEDNYIEYAPLRRGVYWAVGYLVQSKPRYVYSAMPRLMAALSDQNLQNQGIAIWALAECFNAAKGLSNDPIGLSQENNSLAEKNIVALKNFLDGWASTNVIRLLSKDTILEYTAPQLADSLRSNL